MPQPPSLCHCITSLAAKSKAYSFGDDRLPMRSRPIHFGLLMTTISATSLTRCHHQAQYAGQVSEESGLSHGKSLTVPSSKGTLGVTMLASLGESDLMQLVIK